MQDVISLDSVTVVRGGSTILSKVTWQVLEGERWVIMGPNGAGKTTLLQLCAGYLHPSRGTAAVLGEKLGNTAVRDLRTRIGFCSSAIAAMLPPDETVLDSIMTGAHGVLGRWREYYDGDDEQRALDLAQMWGLASMTKRHVGTLSEGERKRVMIARALMADPELLLLDEPAAGLDVAGREDLLIRLALLAEDPASPALVMVTHHVEEVPPNFTHALLLREGTVSARGSVGTVMTSGPMSEAFGMQLIVESSDGRWFARGWAPSRGRRAR